MVTLSVGAIALSSSMAENFKEYLPHYGIHSYTKPRTFSGASSLPEVDIGVLSHWVEEEDYKVQDAGVSLT